MGEGRKNTIKISFDTESHVSFLCWLRFFEWQLLHPKVLWRCSSANTAVNASDEGTIWDSISALILERNRFSVTFAVADSASLNKYAYICVSIPTLLEHLHLSHSLLEIEVN